MGGLGGRNTGIVGVAVPVLQMVQYVNTTKKLIKLMRYLVIKKYGLKKNVF